MKKVFSIALVLLLAILLGGILLWNQQTERRNAARLQQLQREAQPYYQEMTAIRLELQRREREIKIAHDVSGVIIGFVPASADDLAAVKAFADGYSFTPLIILDCAKEEVDLQDIARRSIEAGWNLMLAGITFDQAVLERADSIRALLPEYGDGTEPAFLLRHTYDTAENREALRQHGYQRLVRYSDSLIADVDEFGAPYIAYGFVRSPNASSDLVSRLVAAHTLMTLLVDFTDLSQGTSDETIVTDYLKAVDSRVSSGELVYTDLAEAFDAVVGSESLSRKRQEEFEQYKAEQQQRMDELEEIISEIYSRPDGI